MFEAAFVISLDSDRVTEFYRRQPLDRIIRHWPGVNGHLLKPPRNWTAGEGAWGCYRSHMQILEHCFQHGISSYLAFEDDCVFVDDFDERLDEFLQHVPGDWDQIYLGGQLLKMFDKPPELINDHVFRGINVNRMHAYAVHSRAYEKIYRWLSELPFGEYQPFDSRIGELHEARKLNVYVPHRWLCGQLGGMSLTCGKVMPPNNFFLDPVSVREAYDMQFLPPTLLTNQSCLSDPSPS